MRRKRLVEERKRGSCKCGIEIALGLRPLLLGKWYEM